MDLIIYTDHSLARVLTVNIHLSIYFLALTARYISYRTSTTETTPSYQPHASTAAQQRLV